MRMRRQSAFNLIEVMIAIAIVAIIVGLAVPSYRSFVIRTNRVEGIDGAMASMICQERIYSRFNAYDATECGPGPTANGLYVVSIVTQNANQNVTITATPQGSQSDDSCSALALNEKGIKTANGSSGAASEKCWAGR